MPYNKKQKREYYLKNKEILLKKRNEKKIVCDCGVRVENFTSTIEKHINTWSHKYFTNSL